MLVLETLTTSLAHVSKDANRFTWVRAPIRGEDWVQVHQAGEESPFDPLRLRAGMLQANPYVFVRELRYGLSNQYIRARVIVLTERGHRPQIPWDIYRLIFTAFGQCKGQAFWKVILFCSPSPRIFPPVGTQPSEQHVNGGYAYPNNPQSIVIYREEESERVLLHELLHACGSDNMEQEEWQREVLTETWAELCLIGVLAKGSLKKAHKLWTQQSQWIADQEHQLRQDHSVTNPSHYAYRYTVGRRAVLEGLGLSLPSPSGMRLVSLRFTTPSLI